MVMKIRKPPALLGAALLALSLAPAAPGQTGEDLRQEIEALKEGQQDIRTEIQELKKLLQQRPARRAPSAPDVKGKVFDLGANPVKGQPAAGLTLVEFTDYQ